MLIRASTFLLLYLYFPLTPSLTGQVLANMVAMGSEKFCAERIPGGKVVGKFNYDNVNTKGGSLSLGHPFGATGTHTLQCVVLHFNVAINI